MKLFELENLYVAYSNEQDFRILICANDEFEAKAAAMGYGVDTDLGDFIVMPLSEAVESVGGDINALKIDADYVIIPTEEEIKLAVVNNLVSKIDISKLTANSCFNICPKPEYNTWILKLYYGNKEHEEIELLQGLYTNLQDTFKNLVQKFGLDYDVTFRLEGSIRFNKPIDKDHTDISIGGYEMVMAGKSVQFDFEEFRAYVDEDEPDLLHFECKNPDEDTFEDIADINRFMLEHVETISEFYIDSEEYENGKETDDLYPIAIESLEFVLPYEDFKSIEISKDVVTKFVESEWKETK